MRHSDIKKSDPRRLAEMLSQFSGSPSSGCWNNNEFGAILSHQLAAALESSILKAEAPSSEPAADRSPSLAELFRQKHPPTRLLILVKEWAKARGDIPDGTPPREVAFAIYLTSIIAARLRNGDRISELADENLRQHSEWLLAQPWIDDLLRSLIRQFLQLSLS